MVDFPIRSIVFRIGDQILIPISKNMDEEWFAEDITILTSNPNVGATIVIDFSFTTATVVEYTVDGGSTFVAFNNGIAVVGGQSRYIRVTTDSQINFRAKAAGTLNRCLVGEV